MSPLPLSQAGVSSLINRLQRAEDKRLNRKFVLIRTHHKLSLPACASGMGTPRVLGFAVVGKQHLLIPAQSSDHLVIFIDESHLAGMRYPTEVDFDDRREELELFAFDQWQHSVLFRIYADCLLLFHGNS